MLCIVGIIVEVLVEVGLAISVEINESGNLVATNHVDLVINNFQTEWLIQACSHALPDKFIQVFVQTGDRPHVTTPDGNGCTRTI